MSEVLQVFGNAIWVGAAAMAVYLGVKNDIKLLRNDLAVFQRENMKDHERYENDMGDMEVRLRIVERVHGRSD